MRRPHPAEASSSLISSARAAAPAVASSSAAVACASAAFAGFVADAVVPSVAVAAELDSASADVLAPAVALASVSPGSVGRTASSAGADTSDHASHYRCSEPLAARSAEDLWREYTNVPLPH